LTLLVDMTPEWRRYKACNQCLCICSTRLVTHGCKYIGTVKLVSI